MGANKGGHPMKWDSPQELQTSIDGYYIWAKENNMHITVSGLAWWLDTSRRTLMNYENSDSTGWLNRCNDEDKKEYIHTIKRAKRIIEMGYEELLYDNKKTTGAIFTLKNNYAWCDKQEIVTTSNDTKLSADEVTKQLESLGYKEDK